MKHVLTDMQNSASAWPFAKPVNKDEVADYYLVVNEPMGELFTVLGRKRQLGSQHC